MRQVRDRRGIPQVQVVPQGGGTRRARLAVRGGARWRGGGYRVAFPAELAGVREVGGRGPGVKAAEPEVVPRLAEGAPELEQAGADTAPVVPSKCFLVDCLPRDVREYTVIVGGRYEVIPRRARVPLGGCHIGLTPQEGGHKSVLPALVCSVPV